MRCVVAFRAGTSYNMCTSICILLWMNTHNRYTHTHTRTLAHSHGNRRCCFHILLYKNNFALRFFLSLRAIPITWLAKHKCFWTRTINLSHFTYHLRGIVANFMHFIHFDEINLDLVDLVAVSIKTTPFDSQIQNWRTKKENSTICTSYKIKRIYNEIVDWKSELEICRKRWLNSLSS